MKTLVGMVNVRRLRFYTYVQNNSGGTFTFDESAGITHVVIVQAADCQEANYRAKRIGLYFDGDRDCLCCGPRWSDIWRDDDGTDGPTVYGDPLPVWAHSPYFTKWMGQGRPEVFVHYADGSFMGMVRGLPELEG